jgi:hypothetical protein
MTLLSSVADPFLSFLDPDPDSYVRGRDPAPDPSIIKQKSLEKKLKHTILGSSYTEPNPHESILI